MVINSAAYKVQLTRTDAASTDGAPTPSSQAAAQQPQQKSQDRVSISSKELGIDRLKRELDALPEMRMDRVALARQNMQGGGYRVDPALLAQKMIEQHSSL
ncbi:flagellar biosynthesis anti-sigma factor FlgM [Geomonas sp. Red32]|uniref:flagellar biosynthesis anti-sigma factor FlgM n=1 Tax=Geomonas sp. Red32 TaxID=2912856 RepID=UPI00202CCB03|nr:flagellar biosynthesis anti-sigma factor FlgM [Geomonas sp. Red32]MCM0081165.1 flagellar biosynthesis anti-sigma factor FlgM [Geomonas sp. Red32]